MGILQCFHWYMQPSTTLEKGLTEQAHALSQAGFNRPMAAYGLQS